LNPLNKVGPVLIHNKLTSLFRHVKLRSQMKNRLIFSVLLIFAVGTAAFVRSADTPPPPSFNPDGGTPVGGDPNHPEDKGDLPNTDDQPGGGDQTEMAAPQISEEQMIKNAMEIAYDLYHSEDYEGCAKTTAAILDKYPKRKLFWVRYLRALCLEHDSLYDKAIDEYQIVRKDAPHSTYSHAADFRIGLCQVRLHRNGEGIYTFREIIETDPLSQYRLQAYVHLGNLYREDRNWKQAELIYRDLIHLYPDTSWSHVSMMYLAECYSFSDRPDRAITIYRDMQKTESVPVEFKSQAQLRIGELYLKKRDWQEAVVAFREAVRDYSDVPGVNQVAEEKIAMAEEARRVGNVPYKAATQPYVSTDAPADEAYRLKQQKEALPY
jgi:TolA-binding protein